MTLELLFAAVGYLSGSVLYARIAASLMKKDGTFPESGDGNPGTANAFRYGGFLCGMVTLMGDLLKGFLPVFLYTRSGGSFGEFSLLKSLVLAAPVIGHVFPVFYGFRGGKGIATTFGCLLGLLPNCQPVLVLAAVFILFSIVLEISPHFYRTIAAYAAAMAALLMLQCPASVTYGFLWITITVLCRMGKSVEARPPMEVSFLWTH